MPDYKDILKNGWHPEKSGTSIKGSVKSLVGRGDDKNKYEHHTARPLSSLKDPASFAPPPKRTNTGSLGSVSPTVPQQQQQQEDEGVKQPKPWSLNTTGLSTAGLPPPPARRDVPSRPSSISSAEGVVRGVPLPPARSSPGLPQNPRAPPPPPALPPRLPPRSPAASQSGNALANLTQSISAASITDRDTVPKPNQGAMDRLSAAGINVPGLGIGSPTSQKPPPPSPRTSSPAARQPPQLPSGLSSHLAKAAATTTSFAQRQQQDGSTTATESGSGSGSGYGALAKAGISRYQNATPEQKAAVHNAAKEGYTRYQSATPEQKAAVQNAASSVARSGMSRYDAATPEQKASVSGAATSMFSAAVAAKKKPPPPPPPAKKSQFLSSRTTQEEDGPPPPVPIGTRPVF